MEHGSGAGGFAMQYKCKGTYLQRKLYGQKRKRNYVHTFSLGDRSQEAKRRVALDARPTQLQEDWHRLSELERAPTAHEPLSVGPAHRHQSRLRPGAGHILRFGTGERSVVSANATRVKA